MTIAFRYVKRYRDGEVKTIFQYMAPWGQWMDMPDPDNAEWETPQDEDNFLRRNED